jgi:hypothetical protein
MPKVLYPICVQCSALSRDRVPGFYTRCQDHFAHLYVAILFMTSLTL